MRKYVLAIVYIMILLAAGCGRSTHIDVEEYEQPETGSEYSTQVPEQHTSQYENDATASTVDSGIDDDNIRDIPLECADTPIIFSTTIRIHENMPEFTFHHKLGGYTANPRFVDMERYVNITIVDEAGNIIQEIDGITQGCFMGTVTADLDMSQLRFEDFNFNGYLDMWLVSAVNPGTAGGIWSNFWLWDPAAGQFVLSAQLEEISGMAWLYVNYGTSQLEVRHRAANCHQFTMYYEYRVGEFALVAQEENLFRHGGIFDAWWLTTRTDMLTGEISIKVTSAYPSGIVLVGATPIPIPETTPDIAPWQEAYMALLRDYGARVIGYSPCGSEPNATPGGVFILHDIDGDGIPELIVADRGHFTSYFAVYTFEDCVVVQLKAEYFYDYATRFSVPRSGPGIGMETNEGVWNAAAIMVIDGRRLVPQTVLRRGEGSGEEFGENWEDFRIWWSLNGNEVTEAEHDETYERLFGSCPWGDAGHEREWLWFREISEVYIRVMVLGLELGLP